jgi:hypothetical protein
MDNLYLITEISKEISLLTETVNSLTEENRRLRLVIGLLKYKKPRGRPRKSDNQVIPAEKKGRGRHSKNLISGENLLSEINHYKKIYDISSDTAVLDKLMEDTVVSHGYGRFRAQEKSMQRKKKTWLNRISEARNSSQKIK